MRDQEWAKENRTHQPEEVDVCRRRGSLRMKSLQPQAKIDQITARAYRVPTDFPESNGTLEWNSTTMVLVHARSGKTRGLGYSYTSSAAAVLIHELLGQIIQGADAF